MTAVNVLARRLNNILYCALYLQDTKKQMVNTKKGTMKLQGKQDPATATVKKADNQHSQPSPHHTLSPYSTTHSTTSIHPTPLHYPTATYTAHSTTLPNSTALPHLTALPHSTTLPNSTALPHPTGIITAQSHTVNSSHHPT